ncbi:MAG: hypothetical protein KAS23_16990 [Anaerohalosphaera sp.]|nr:hypothetical protein [Anaerohalosphaera sp.]
MEPNSKKRLIHAVLAIVYAIAAVFCLAGLCFFVLDMMSGRRGYHTPMPFVFGGFIALFLGVWPPSKFLSGWKKHVIRATIFTLCLAPLPVGPEGTLLPAVFGFFYPPLFFMFPQGVLLVFFAVIFISLCVTKKECRGWR